MNRTLSVAVAGLVCPLHASASFSPDRSANPANGGAEETRLIADFNGKHPHIDPLSGRWRTVNDNIMGGRSLGGGKIQNGVMVFAGSTNTNGGGFASIRANDQSWNLTGFAGLTARVRADGRRYVFHVFTGLNYDNGNVFYRGEFETKPLVDTDGHPTGDPEAWQKVFVAFADFVPMVRGRAVVGSVDSLDPSKIRGVGVMIDDGLDGPFRLHADWIRAKASNPRDRPRSTDDDARDSGADLTTPSAASSWRASDTKVH